MQYPVRAEIVLGDLPEINVPEIQVSYSRQTGKRFLGQVKSVKDVSDLLRSTFDNETIELQEQFVVLYLNSVNDIIGYYRHSRGTIHTVTADIRIILGVALKCGCVSLIIAHNHPSGLLQPSEPDLKLTNEFKKAASFHNINLLDHFIFSRNNFYSFAQKGQGQLAGVESLINPQEKFVEKVSQDLTARVSHNKRSIEKLAATFGITSKTEVKELTELAIVKRARELAHSNGTLRERFDKIVDLYGSQVNLSHRTSHSILLQQYSTPAPISYLAGVFCGVDKPHQKSLFFEPSAGNGLLTIAGNPIDFVVNEIDSLRNRNLKTQDFLEVTKVDATKPFSKDAKRYDAVLSNPPFGVSETVVMYDTFRIRSLEHVMALRTLDCMKDKGRAAIIIGGHTRWDDKGRIQKGKNRIFFNYLYNRYNVVDVINIDGHKLYSRQGTSFNVRLILINGRKPTPSGAAPVHDPQKDVVIKTFDELFSRIMEAVNEVNQQSKEEPQITIQKQTHSDIIYPITNEKGNSMRYLELEAEALELELQLLKVNIEKELGAIIPGNINKESYQRYLNLKEKYKELFKVIVLLKKEGTDEYETFDLDAERLVYMFSFPFTQFSLIGGKKVYGITISQKQLNEITSQLQKAGYIVLALKEDNSIGELDAPYEPASNACIVLNTQVPDSMAFETHSAINQIKEEVGGDIDNFIRHRLRYPSKKALCQVLSAEQIDAVAMAIYNIEARNQGMIIGDQTGIGKGRVAAAMIRYGVLQGMKPVFLTEKANLFSDIYRDLSAIGSAHLKPFIVNNREPKTDIKDEDGNVIYTAPAPEEQRNIIESREVPARYDFVVATYSQFNSKDKKPAKPNFLIAIANDNLFIMDEAHNSSGSGNTGEFLQGVIGQTRGVVFLSATFAKRPDNMPIYALKTAISDCNMTRDDLVEAINRGGVALQEVLSSQLVGEGQMLRRERSFEGVEVNYITLEDKAEEHKAIADNITEVLRDIIAFQGNHVDKEVEDLDKIAVAESKEVTIREGTSQAGVDNQPYFSKIFNVINQMLFSLKAEAVAEKTIERLKEGKKVVIAFASTMGSFIETMESDNGTAVGDGDTINTDFSEVLKRGLDGILRYTEKDIDGNSIFKKFSISDFSPEAQIEYQRILEKIQAASTGITISPIDVVIKKIKAAGYTVAEVTGRKYEMQLNNKGSKALVMSRKKVNTNDAFRQFNNNEVDVLMINQSGSTGASAHAIPTAKVPKEQVKQRVMIVLQAELDISTEVQKRGRINRTGQILKPIYDYVSSAIPAEKRLMMMLQKKLKSLDANTTSNQKQSSKILDVPDFLNKYGDKLVKEYLLENPEVNMLLDDPLHMEDSNADSSQNSHPVEDAAMKVSGRVAVLSTKMQEDFYNDIAERYFDYVEYLKQVGEYDLEVEAMNLEAETVSAKVLKMGKGGETAFGDDSMLETVKANVLKKPFTKTELENLIHESLKGKDPVDFQNDLIGEYNSETDDRLSEMMGETNEKYDQLVKDIPAEKKIKKLEGNQQAWLQAVQQREKELNEARDMQLKNTEKNFNNRKHYIEKILKFYYVGRLLHYPVEIFGNGSEEVPAVFVGFIIDSKKKNPYAPSAIKLRFAIANSSKYLAMPASYSEEIMAIIGASADVSQPDVTGLLHQWEAYTKENNVDRKIRHIVTGNLLQAFSDMKGKLVSYTTIDKQVKKGILLPENWNPGEEVQDNVVVPILKALPIIKSLVDGKHIITNNGLSIFRNGEYFKLIIAASRSKGGDIYLDRQILELVTNNNFEKTSDKMVAMLPENSIGKLVELLQNNHSCSITIQSHQLKDLAKSAVISATLKKIQLPPIVNEPEDIEEEPDNIRILELEAEALTLELELMAA
ncbi:MAG: JAB domain-containing protein [Chitinophagaceae bacterium]